MPRLPAPATLNDTAAFIARGAVEELPGGRWSMRLEFSHPGGTGQRQLEGDSCEELVDAAALMLSLAPRSAFWLQRPSG